MFNAKLARAADATTRTARGLTQTFRPVPVREIERQARKSESRLNRLMKSPVVLTLRVGRPDVRATFYDDCTILRVFTGRVREEFILPALGKKATLRNARAWFKSLDIEPRTKTVSDVLASI